jgi:hypothetical protein
MYATALRLAGKSADHTLYHAHPKVSPADGTARGAAIGKHWSSRGGSVKVVETESGRRVGDKWKEATRGDATSVRTREEWSAESRTASELSSNRDIDHKRVGTQSTSMLQQSRTERTILHDTSRAQARQIKGDMDRGKMLETRIKC